MVPLVTIKSSSVVSPLTCSAVLNVICVAPKILPCVYPQLPSASLIIDHRERVGNAREVTGNVSAAAAGNVTVTFPLVVGVIVTTYARPCPPMFEAVPLPTWNLSAVNPKIGSLAVMDR